MRQPRSSDDATQLRTATDSNTALGQGAIDELLERYICWREECRTIRLAYRRWADSPRGERGLTYAAYLAALDREEHAAGAYPDQTDRLRRISA